MVGAVLRRIATVQDTVLRKYFRPSPPKNRCDRDHTRPAAARLTVCARVSRTCCQKPGSLSRRFTVGCDQPESRAAFALVGTVGATEASDVGVRSCPGSASSPKNAQESCSAPDSSERTSHGERKMVEDTGWASMNRVRSRSPLRTVESITRIHESA